MITVTARINISNNGGTINSIVNQNIDDKNNVSANINKVLGKRNISVGNPFILGSSRLDSGAKYTNSTVPYFIGGQLSDRIGNFAKTYNFTIRGTGISSVMLVFDKENGGHPNSVWVDNEIIYDDDAQFEIVFKNTANAHLIGISNWNKPYSPLIISAIYADISIEIDESNLISFDSDIVDRSDIKYPSFGIVSNSANLTFSDFDEQVLDLIAQQILHSGIKVDVFLNNTDSNTEEQICLMETRELSYDNENRQVQVSLKDNLEKLQEIEVKPLYYYNEDGSNKEPQTAQQYYEYLWSQTPEEFGFLSFSALDDSTKERLSSTTIQYPILENGTLWDSWQKLCELCLLHIYVDNEGNSIVKYSRAD